MMPPVHVLGLLNVLLCPAARSETLIYLIFDLEGNGQPFSLPLFIVRRDPLESVISVLSFVLLAARVTTCQLFYFSRLYIRTAHLLPGETDRHQAANLVL
ncbi:hypothetical protein EV126DRAFT_233743 [Verticillium dahliae]|nr:hypothetical protein EV126DRAFT_233743 [Verticillium dahliae]